MSVTGLILTFNGERLLDRCLASLDFCDEILVVDSLSTDRTVEIAEARGARVLGRAWEGPLPQFRFALEQIGTDWVVSLDQDEYLSDELRANLAYTLRNAPETDGDQAGHVVNRRNWYYDRYMRHSGWYPDSLFRVFRNGRMEPRASGAHYSFHPLGRTERLPGDIVHHPYVNMGEQLEKINYYAQSGADEKRTRGRWGGAFIGQMHASARFLKLYLVKLGFLDGRAGFINALCGAHYAFEKYLRITEPEGLFPSYRERFAELNRMAGMEAEALRASGRKLHPLWAFLSAKWSFFREYFVRGEYRHGTLGYARSVTRFYLTFYKWVRANEPPPPKV